MAGQALVQSIVPLVAHARGPLLFVGRLALARQLHEALPELIVAETRSKPRRLARHLEAGHVLRCAVDALPLRARSVQGLIIEQLRGEGAEALERYSSVLADGGRFVLVQPLRGALRHAFYSFGRGLPRYRPEDLTSLLLAAGFAQIRQHWPEHRAVLTSGMLQRLPSRKTRLTVDADR